MLSILFGLSAAIGWGAGDFSGGLASRKTGAYRAVLYGEIAGIGFLLIAILLFGESIPGLKVWLLSALAGALGTVGLLLLYHAMSLGLMSVAAPVSALLAALFPVIVGMFTQGAPKPITILGFGFALFAVWMISQAENGVADIIAHIADLKLPLLAGIGFGAYFIVIHQATQSGAIIFPMIASRLGGLILVVIYMLSIRADWRVTDHSAWKIIILNGFLDLSGNAFFILAAQTGRLDVAAVLSSLYPGATVVLAWIILKERLSRNQWVGIAAALTAIILMTI